MKINSLSKRVRNANFRQSDNLEKFCVFLSILFTFAFAVLFLPQNETASAQSAAGKNSDRSINPHDVLNRFKSANKLSANAGGDPCEPQPISFGQTISGSLVTGDCTDPETGQVADVYIFSGTQGQAISSAYSSSQFDTVLILGDLSGNVIAFNDDIDATTTNSRIPPTGTFSLPFTGQYILFATSFDPSERGSYTINLLGSGTSCDFTLTPPGQHFISNGGNGIFTVSTSLQTCQWQAASSAPWVTTSSSGTGNGTVSFTVAANASTQARAAIITVGNKFFSVTQNGLSCSYQRSPIDVQVPAIGGQFSFTINASNSLCPTDVTTNDNWITVQNPTGTGTRVINYTVAPNNVPVSRNGTFTIGGSQYGILQWWRPTPFSFDTGAQANLAVYRPNGGLWFFKNNNFNTGEPAAETNAVAFGIATDKIAPADYDGDNRTDIAVFRDGAWYIIESRNFTFRAAQFGTSGDKPVPGDFDGDQKADISVYRPSSGNWFRLNSGNSQFVAVQFGTSEDVPLLTDFNADGRSEISVYRPSAGAWYWLDSATGAFNAVSFGISTDIPVPADYDGDSKTDIAVYRPAGGAWYRLNSSNGQFAAVQFGAAEDIPVPAEYDRDGKADIAVFRPSIGTWFRLKSTNGTFDAWQFGTAGDKPIPAAYQP
jgi:hypothetical protein